MTFRYSLERGVSKASNPASSRHVEEVNESTESGTQMPAGSNEVKIGETHGD